jgi:hypothetical protein
MSETILILKMDSHFHGNDRHKQNRRSLPIFMGMADINKKTGEACPFSWE